MKSIFDPLTQERLDVTDEDVKFLVKRGLIERCVNCQVYHPRVPMVEITAVLENK